VALFQAASASGPGSSLAATDSVRSMLARLLPHLQVSSLLDVGCRPTPLEYFARLEGGCVTGKIGRRPALQDECHLWGQIPCRHSRSDFTHGRRLPVVTSSLPRQPLAGRHSRFWLVLLGANPTRGNRLGSIDARAPPFASPSLVPPRRRVSPRHQPCRGCRLGFRVRVEGVGAVEVLGLGCRV
jgi:hypothetical protein